MARKVKELHYKNPYYRKLRRAYPMLVRCAVCKHDLVMYQKRGKGGLIKLRLDRILSANFPIREDSGAMTCPNCGNLFAKRSVYKGHIHFFILRGTVNTTSYY